jgi:hypothetical protein
METTNLSVEIIKIILTFVVAVAASYIAWRQHRTAADKFRLDLYDKRYRVYRGLIDLLSRIAADGSVPNGALDQFFRATDEKRFLFGPDVISYLKEVREKAVRLSNTRRLIEAGERITEGRHTAAIDESLELTQWFDKQGEEAQHKFYPYLSFTHKL